MPKSRGLPGKRQRKWVIALALLVLALGLANFIRMSVAIVYWTRLPQLPMRVSWAYLAGGGLFWGAAFGVSAVGLLWFRQWGRWATLVVVTVYEIYVWINHLLFDASVYARQTWLGDLVLTILLLVLVLGGLNWRSIRKVLE